MEHRCTRVVCGVAAGLVLTVSTMVAAMSPVGARTSIQVEPATASSPTDLEARRIVRQYSVANEKNNDTLDIEGQGAVETAPLQLIDDATFREARGRGDSSLHERSTTDQIRVYVPDLTTYPLQFLASERVSSGDGHFRQLLVFVKASESDPWRVSMAAQASGDTSFPKVLRTRDGDAAPLDVDHAAALVAPPESLAPALADRWAREAGEERAPDKVFADGSFTTGTVDRLVSELAQLGINALVDFQFAAGAYPVVAYRTGDGGALVLFAVDVQETITPDVDDESLVQPRSRERFTGLVVPGRYAEVGFDRIAIVAAKVPTQGSDARVEVVGVYDGFTAATATALGATAPVGLR